MKIGLAQFRCVSGDVAANCLHMEAFATQAKDSGCNLLVIPEMSDTGYEMVKIGGVASAWNGLPATTLSKSAKKNNLYIIAGISEREGGKVYNSAAIFNPKGELIGGYRKAHLFSHDPVFEDRYLACGETRTLVTIGDFKCGIIICYDLRFPELSRALTLAGAEAIIVCSAWPFPRVGHWKTLTAARAIENQLYVVAANRVGTDGALTFCGSSSIIEPTGNILAMGSEDKEELVVGEISSETVRMIRSKMPIIKDRRVELYK